MSFLCSFPLLQGFIIYCYWYDSSYLGIIFDGRIRLRSGFQGFKGFEGSQGKVKELLFLVFVGFVRCYQLLQILFHINYHFFRDHWKDGNGFEASDSWSVIIQSCFHFPLILRRIYYLISLLRLECFWFHTWFHTRHDLLFDTWTSLASQENLLSLGFNISWHFCWTVISQQVCHITTED